MGLFDVQVNGFAGVDFQGEGLTVAAMRRAVDGLAAHGTEGFFPTLVTDSIEALERKFAALEEARRADAVIAAAVRGYHLEGPWLSPKPGFRGAHDPRFMGPPNLGDFERLQAAAGGMIRFVTLAPEWPGSGDFILALSGAGVCVSLGHTDASMAEIEAAVEAGARFCTHLGNGVPIEMHRHDNVIQRLLAFDELTAFFIPDGIHVPWFALRNFLRAKPPGRKYLTTDCMAAAGAPPGRYRLGAAEVEVGEDRVVRRPGELTFAGSALAPDEGVANAVAHLGLSAEDAAAMFSEGCLRPG